MRLLEDENRILISLFELVSIARRKACSTVPLDEDEPGEMDAAKFTLELFGIQKRERIEYDTQRDGISFRITASADSVSDNKITLIRRTAATTKGQQRAEEAQCRAEAFILGKIIAEKYGYDEMTLKIDFLRVPSD